MAEEFGYIAIQSTRPQTLAYGLTDSPVGQLAWLMDKFREWTHPRSALPDKVIDRVKGYGGHVMQTSLAEEQEENLRAALGETAATV